MRRQIIILCCFILCAFGASAGECCPECPECPDCCEPEYTTWECDCPEDPWSGGDQCAAEVCTCGTIYGFNVIDFHSQIHGGIFGVHSDGGIDGTLTWARTENAPFFGSVNFELQAGNYQFSTYNSVEQFFDGDPKLGAYIVDWRACGDAYIYADFFADHAGSGQRSFRQHSTLCPTSKSECLEPIVAKYQVEGCYELPITAGTYVRGQFLNTSEVDWQIISVEGYGTVYVPPLIPEDAQVAQFLFNPKDDTLVTICIGKEHPWSDPREWGDGCVLAAFEQVNSQDAKRLTVLPRPLLEIGVDK